MSYEGIILLLCSGAPLLLAMALIVPSLRPLALRLAPWAAIPALATPFVVEPGALLVLPWVLLGTTFALDETGRVFLAFSGLLWLAAGLYARAAIDRNHLRFFSLFLLTMAGNLGLIVAADIPSFYLFFALMSFAAYGIIVQRGTLEAFRAGRVYLILVVIGELLLTAGLIAGSAQTGGLAIGRLAEMAPNLFVFFCLLLGFGVKAGLVLLHVYLPLAYRAAPTPVAVALGGAMLHAGLLGWLRFLPLGQSHPGLGALIMGLGLIGVFYGVAVGLGQNHPRELLAYSSMSQMGLMTIALGVGLALPEAWPLAHFTILLYALHHALAKGALFYVLGARDAAPEGPLQYAVVLVGLWLPSLALAGAPLTSGALAKIALKSSIDPMPPPWHDWLTLFLALASVGTTLLMARFLYLARPRRAPAARLPGTVSAPLLALLAAVALATWLWPAASGIRPKALSPAGLWSALWPVAVGALLGWETWVTTRSGAGVVNWRVPPGDVLVPVERAVARASKLAGRSRERIGEGYARGRQVLTRALGDMVFVFERLGWEQQLGRWVTAGALYLALILGLAWAYGWPGGR